MIADRLQAAVKRERARLDKFVEDHARARHAEIQRVQPSPAQRKRNGRRSIAKAKLGDVVSYEYSQMTEIVDALIEALIKRSPPTVPGGVGTYRDSHIILINGAEVPDAKGWKPGDELIVTNKLPYARKIEVGHMRMRKRGTDAVYHKVLPGMKRRFGKRVTFTFFWHETRFPAIRVRAAPAR